MGKPKLTDAKLSKTARASSLKKGGKGREVLCSCGQPLFGTLYYPSLGRPVNARGCGGCAKVWDLTGRLLADDVPFTGINWGKR